MLKNKIELKKTFTFNANKLLLKNHPYLNCRQNTFAYILLQ